MRAKFLFSLLFATIAFVANAQDYTFKVLVNKGKNEFKAGGKWAPLTVGASLRTTDELKVSENSYVGLIHSSGRPLEVKNAGTYKISALSEKVGNGSSVLNKYTDFILSSNNQKKGNLAATGAVHRGPNSIRIYLPTSDNAYVFNDSVTLHWSNRNSTGPYTLIFTNFFSDELLKIETPDSVVTVNLNHPKLAAEEDIQVQVIANGEKKSETYTMRRLSKQNRDRIQLDRQEIAGMIQEQNALNKLVEASFYEQNKLLIDAASAFQKAIQMAPDVPMFQEAYREFLLRNQLTAPK